jgi:hypothetical protein
MRLSALCVAAVVSLIAVAPAEERQTIPASETGFQDAKECGSCR